jgi:hypothetical protein
VKGISRKTKRAVGKPTRLIRKPSRVKRQLPWRFRIVLGAGGLVLAVAGFVLRRILKS